MKKAYLEGLKKLRTFRKSLLEDIDIKRGKMYFTWIKDKTEKVINEKDDNYIYTNVINYTLPKYVITQYTFNKANKIIKSIIKNNKITNAVNHGIDIRHGTGPNVTVFNNTIIGSKEGIYLMHSGGHTVYNNTLINCTISSITCYGSSNIYIYNNTMFKSRMGVLLGSGFSNITIGENNYNLANLPYPPTFVYYVGIADSAYQSPQSVSGTYSDSSTYSPEYTNKIDIEAPKDIVIDYNGILKPTGTTYTVPVGTASEDIQKMIDSMKDGDTLSFEKNGIYENICIYVDKNIKILGNNATLIGYETKGVNNSNIPLKVWKKTN